MTTKLEIPRLSETVSGGTIIRWIRQVGDHTGIGDTLAEIDADGAVIELLAQIDGTITDILAPAGTHVEIGTTAALLQPSTIRSYTAKPEPAARTQNPVRLSPLARKIAESKNIDPSSIQGTGPRGKIMASDLTAVTATQKQADYPIARKASQEQRILSPASRIDNYYIYTFEANMSQLAEISTPIAVQSEKFLGGRYCLFDYVARAAVKAFAFVPETLNTEGDIDLLMIVNKGQKDIPLAKAVKQTIHDIAVNRNVGEPEEVPVSTPPDYRPNLLVCDAGARVDAFIDKINGRPSGMVILGGTSPKTGIEAGRPIQKLMLPITVYIDTAVGNETLTTKVASEFKSLMENPVLLLF